MNVLIAADEELTISFLSPSEDSAPEAAEEAADEAADEAAEGLEIGTPVTIKVTAGGTALPSFTAKVGDVLRQTLLDNGVPVYKSMSKMTSCGGNGQTATCKVVLEAEDGVYPERSEWEEKKLKKFPENARLSCVAVVLGDTQIEDP